MKISIESAGVTVIACHGNVPSAVTNFINAESSV